MEMELLEIMSTQLDSVVVQMTLPKNFSVVSFVIIFLIMVLFVLEIIRVSVALVQMKRSGFTWQLAEKQNGASEGGERRMSDYIENMRPSAENSLAEDSRKKYKSVADAALKTKLEQIIRDNISNPSFSIAEISRMMNMDRTGLYRKVLEVYEMSPSNLLQARRVERVKEILDENPDMSVPALAEATGFKSNAVMERLFSLQTGTDIPAYRSVAKRNR